jgi:signal transduction histidine kinase
VSPIKTPADGEQEWPFWVPFASAALIFATLAASVYQRHRFYFLVSHGHVTRAHAPLWVFIVFAAVAFFPFLLDCTSLTVSWLRTIPISLFPVPVLIGVSYFVFHPTNIDFAPFVLVFMSAELASRTVEKPALAFGAPLASIALMIGADVSGRFQGALIWVIGITFGWFGGYLVSMVERRSQALRLAQAGLAEKAAADERSRIAREVHDVIAHSMSVTMLHITAARMALEKHKPDEALDALQEAERQGRSSMSDIRRTVGLLGPDGGASAQPMPGATDLPKLVNDFRGAGLAVDLRMDGDFRALNPAAGLSLYRIVQESLTNVAKHCPGAETSVLLVMDDEKIHLTVRNASGNGTASSGDGSGIGLRGMIERATVLDGDLFAGPSGDGWLVELTAPRTKP